MVAAGFEERARQRLARGRALARSRMDSTGTVRRLTGRKVQNPETGREEPVWEIVHSEIPARLRTNRAGDGAAGVVTEGGVSDVRGRRELHLLHDVTDLRDDDLVDLVEGEWAGTVWRLTDATPGGDQATARRLPVVQTTRPAEWG